MIGKCKRSSTRLFRSVAALLVTLGEARSEIRRDPRRGAHFMHLAFARICQIHGMKVRVSGQRPEGPVILAANHIGYIDPMVISAHASCIPIAKAEVRSWPLIGAAAEIFGTILVKRDDPGSRVVALRKAMRVLEAGNSVLNFPEGTTTDGSLILPFHRGIFGIAQRVGCPVVPTVLRFSDPRMAWTGNATLPPHYWLMSTQPTIEISIEYDTPLNARDFASPEELAAATRARLRKKLNLGDSYETASLLSAKRRRVLEPRTKSILSTAHG
jgi:1-acyl-sn-glycerol-3-phosphate acyltransferase